MIFVFESICIITVSYIIPYFIFSSLVVVLSCRVVVTSHTLLVRYSLNFTIVLVLLYE